MKRPGYYAVKPLAFGDRRRNDTHRCPGGTCGCQWACNECGGRDMEGGIHDVSCSRVNDGAWIFSEKHGLRKRLVEEHA